ncbi:MAG: hypothetical protein ACTSX9_01575 [Candidatus Njordarchaeales archaeon]
MEETQAIRDFLLIIKQILEFIGRYPLIFTFITLALVLVLIVVIVASAFKIGIRGGALPRILAYSIIFFILETLIVLVFTFSKNIETQYLLRGGLQAMTILSFTFMLAILLELWKVYKILTR